jgi:Immunity protein 63
MKPTLADIKKLVEFYAKKINASESSLPTYGNWKDGHPNVEVDDNGQLYYEVYERGQQVRNDFAGDEEGLFYKIFSGITFSMALEYELKNRVPGQDNRRIMFAKQEDLLGQLDERWKEQAHKERLTLLKRHPFDDNAIIRIDYLVKLKQQGMTHKEASSKANEKYPPVTKSM